MFVSHTSAVAGAQDLSASETAVRQFAPLAARGYDVVVIDPPWPFKTRSPKGQLKSASMHYRIMTLAEIKELPVGELLKDDAVVFLWTTGPLLDEAIPTLKGWGITYVAHFAWRKVSRNGKKQWGTGYWARSCHETVLLGTVGKPPCFSLPSCFDGLRREHSRKPDEFFRWSRSARQVCVALTCSRVNTAKAGIPGAMRLGSSRRLRAASRAAVRPRDRKHAGERRERA